MICNKCGKDFSDTVLPLHSKRCVVEPVEQEPEPAQLTKEEMKALLDDAGIKYTARMGKSELLELIEGIEE